MGLGFCLWKSILASSIDSTNECGTFPWRGVPTVEKTESKLSTDSLHLPLLPNCRHTVCSCFRLLWTVPSSICFCQGIFSQQKERKMIQNIKEKAFIWVQGFISFSSWSLRPERRWNITVESCLPQKKQEAEKEEEKGDWMGYIYAKGLSSMAFFQRVPTPQWSIKIWIPLVMGKPSGSSYFSVTPAVNSDVLGSAWAFRCFMSKLQHWWKAEVFSSRQECVILVLLLSTVLTQVMGISSIRKKDICTCEWYSLLCKYPKTLLKKKKQNHENNIEEKYSLIYTDCDLYERNIRK